MIKRPFKILEKSNIPDELIPQNITLKMEIYQYIKSHPKCSIKDVKRFGSESNIRRSIDELVGLKLIKKDKCGCGLSYVLEAIK